MTRYYTKHIGNNKNTVEYHRMPFWAISINGPEGHPMVFSLHRWSYLWILQDVRPDLCDFSGYRIQLGWSAAVRNNSNLMFPYRLLQAIVNSDITHINLIIKSNSQL